MASTDVAVPEPKTPAKVLEKPLTATAQKNLSQIIEGDFRDLKQQVQVNIKERLSRREDEIAEEFGNGKRINAAARKVNAAVEKAREALVKIYTDAYADGLLLQGKQTFPQATRLINISAPDDFTVPGKEEAVNKARRSAQRLQDRALQLIDQRQRAAQRKVLLAGISTTTAAEIVNELPATQTILDEITAEVSIGYEDDLKELGLIDS